MDVSDGTEYLHNRELGNIMDLIIAKLCDLGALGILAALLAYDVFFLQKKLITIIENNTKAMSDLKSYCTERHHRKTDE